MNMCNFVVHACCCVHMCVHVWLCTRVCSCVLGLLSREEAANICVLFNCV